MDPEEAGRQQQLQYLEAILDQFYSQPLPADRRRALEQMLVQYRQAPTSWRECGYFMSHTTHQMVIFYSCTVFEELVLRMWDTVDAQCRQEVRQFLFQYLLENEGKLLPMSRTKLIKAIVDVGKRDWPHDCPEFFTNVLAVTANRPALGLEMVRMVVEEFTSETDSVSGARREQLLGLLMVEVPQLLQLMVHIFTNLLDKHAEQVLTAPTQSPNRLAASPLRSPMAPKRLSDVRGERGASPRGLQIPKKKGQNVPGHKLFTTSPYGSPAVPGSPVSSFISQQGGLGRPREVNMDPEDEEVCRVALECLTELIKRLPIAQQIDYGLLASVFRFAHLNDENAASMGVCALSCINVVLETGAAPFEDYQAFVLQQVLVLLQKLTKEKSTLEDAFDEYICAVVEINRVFMRHHFSRIEDNAHFPIIHYLSLLFKFTYMQPTVELFMRCGEIWLEFLEMLQKKAEDAKSDAELAMLAQRYQDGVMCVSVETLRKMQFSSNGEELSAMDAEGDEDGPSELEEFLAMGFDLIGMISDIFPENVFNHVAVEQYSSLHNFLQGDPSVFECGEQEGAVKALLHDMSTLVRLVAVLAPCLLGRFQDLFQYGLVIVRNLTELAAYSLGYRLYRQGDLMATVHIETYRTLLSLCEWMMQLSNDQSNAEHFTALMEALVALTLPALSNQVPEGVARASAQLLQGVTTKVRPRMFVSLKPVATFIDTQMSTLDALPPDVQVVAVRALSNAFTLPWYQLPDPQQQWDARMASYQRLAQPIVSQIEALPQTLPTNPRDREEVCRHISCKIQVLGGIVRSVRDTPKSSKVMIYKSFEPVFSGVLARIQVPDLMVDVLDFALVLVESLKTQVGVSFVEQTITTLLALFNQNSIGQSAKAVIEKFLRLLQFVVQERAKAYEAFVPNIIALINNQIFPLLTKEDGNVEALSELYLLVYLILLNHWKYFYPSTISGHGATMRNQPQFAKLIEMFPLALGHTDLHLFHQCLAHLQNLNTKVNLYSKDAFDSYRYALMQQLLDVLVAKTHQLHSDIIASSIYHLAAKDLSSFYKGFLPQYISSRELNDEQKQNLMGTIPDQGPSDEPTCSQLLLALTADLRYFAFLRDAPASLS